MADAAASTLTPGIAGLRRFLRWWGTELRAAVPAKIQRHFAGRTAQVHVRVSAGDTHVSVVEGSNTRELAVCDLFGASHQQLTEAAEVVAAGLPDRVAVTVEIPQEQVLTHEFSLPLATEAGLDNVLRFELDRLTPFRLDQVNFAARVTGRFPERDQLRVRIAAVRRNYLDEVLDRVAQLNLTPDAVVPASPGDSSPADSGTWNLLSVEQRPVSEPLLNATNRRLLLALGVLLGLVLGYPLYQQNLTLTQLEDQIRLIQGSASQVGEKLQELRASAEAETALANRKQETPAKLQVVNAITRLLPDNTWVTRLEVNTSGTVVLQGESTKASDLIAILQQHTQFSNVEFASAVSRNPSTNMERFEIRMTLAKGAAP